MTFSGIYAIVDTNASPDPLTVFEDCLSAGIRLLQYRAKSGIDRALLRRMLVRAQAAQASLIVNDDFEAALEADGWHAGPEDLVGRDLRELRGRLGSRIFGISAGDPDEARAAEAAGADYVGTGPFAATGSKEDAGPAIGPAGIARVREATRLPVVAIGGIGLSNVEAVARSGASMAAVISAIAGAPFPERAARELVERWRALHR